MLNYVKDVCRKLKCGFLSRLMQIVPLMVKQTGVTEEEAGRQARYKLFLNEP